MAGREENIIEKESFRDKISTVDAEGKRIWLYPKKPSGKFTAYREYVGYCFLALFIAAPFIRINEEPLILLNILERHFVLFGVVFWPQDFHLFLLGMLTFIIFIVLFTVIYGRVFCGWACPQTIFMEIVFRKIEYFIEGDWKDQKVLDRSPWNANKILRKSAKHFIFFVISFFISNLFLTYIIGSDAWLKIISESPASHLGGLSSMIVFTGVFYSVYARFREQICTTICPYGRLQGVMLDKNSIVVAYDYIRGEKRAHIRKNEDRKLADKGDCIDCNHCVHVCPTGIDIRNGIQMECINCTACIDACDTIMEKVGMPKGLIRLDSEEGIAKQEKFRWTKRILGYSFVLILLIGILVTLLVTRPDVETSVLRTPGMLYQTLENGNYSNLYNIKIINKTRKTFPLEFKLEDIKGEIKMVGQTPEAKSKSISEGAFFIVLNKNEITKMKTRINIGVYENGKRIETVNTTFVGPAQ